MLQRPALGGWGSQKTGFAAAAVLVVSEIFCVYEHIADVARRFAEAGDFAKAPEMFLCQGDAQAGTGCC